MKCSLSRRSLSSHSSSKLQCDYLQYTTVPPPPPGSPPSKPYYSSTMGGAGGPLSSTLDSEALYYTLQPVYSSSSGSASSDPACTTSSYNSPVQYNQYSHPSPVQHPVGQYGGAVHSALPSTPLMYSQHPSPSQGGHHYPDQYEGANRGGGGGVVGTHKKRTLVKYRYPDVLPSDNTNQNYYV